MKIAVVFWSGTGNTEAMAQAVAEGARKAGAAAERMTSDAFGVEQVAAFEAFAFGCPAMGAEVLEEESFDPMFTACENALAGKRVALFGSYGWGDGEWMRAWERHGADDGISLVAESVICQEAPDEDALNRCRDLGIALAQ